MNRVVVVGGGIIGAACAHYLSAAGASVTLLDRGVFGRGCSHANCGYVCPSHVLPLAAPGAITGALRVMFARNSALRVKPRLSLSLARWLFSFARHCNARDVGRSAVAIQALLNSSRALYEDWVYKNGLECEWQSRGLLFVFRTAGAMEHYAHIDRLLRDNYQMPASRIDGIDLVQMEPALRPGLAGGWLYESDAHLRPDRLMESLRQDLMKRNVEIREHCELLTINRSVRRAISANTTQGTISADSWVIATGAWTPLLAQQLGCRILIEPGKGYSITMPRPAICPQYPLIFEEDRVAITPMQSGYRIGSTMEFAGYDASLDPVRLELLRAGASRYLKTPIAEPVEEEWFGWRPMTPDGLPIIGKAPAFDNVWLAAGHNMLELSMAPATGKLVAELITNREPHIDPKPYTTGRF